MADKRITQIATTYDRDDLALATDYLIGDRSGGSSFRILAEEVVRSVLENSADPIIIANDVNVDSGTLFVDVSANRVGLLDTSPAATFTIRTTPTNSVTTTESGAALRIAGTFDYQRWDFRLNTSGDLVLDSEVSGVDAAYVRIARSGGHFVPGTDDAQDLGAAAYRWDDIYATNGTIQTSDGRTKLDIAESDLGLDFIESLRPVSFRRENGKRRHYGLIAQEVETALAGRDFAGVLYNAEADQYGMRYDELIAPLIKAVQELSARVSELEAGI